jgi:hypothetical protein
VNRHTTPPQTNPPYTNGHNGHYEAPLELSGVSLRRPAPVHKPTTFLAELPLRGLGPLIYGLHRFHLSGLPLSRYIALLWLVIALFAAGGVLPGRWITMSIALLLWVGQIWIGLRYRQQRYVTFTGAPLPVLNDTPLDVSEKLPVYATGLLSVEGRYQRYSALPGFYRTFATGEHAILCRLQERNWLRLFTWPTEETGMWYAFVNPSDIEQLTWGTLHFGENRHPALAIEYRLELPPGPRRKQAEIRQEILYLASPEPKDAQRLYVDLLNNLPAGKIVTSLSAPKA